MAVDSEWLLFTGPQSARHPSALFVILNGLQKYLKNQYLSKRR